MAGVRVQQAAVEDVREGEEERDVLAVLDRVVKEAVGPPHDGAHRQLVADQRGDRCANGRRQQRRRDALPHHVGDDHAPAVVADGDELVVVAADHQRRLVRARDVESRQVGRGPRQQAHHHLARQGQLAVEPALGHHGQLQPRALDRAGDRQPVGGEQLRRLGPVAVGIVRPDVQHAQHPVGRAQDGHQEPRAGARAPLQRLRQVVGRDLERLAGGEHLSDDALAVERRFHLGDREVAAADQGVAQLLAAAVDDVDAGRVRIDERPEAVEDALQDVLGLAQRRETKRVDHDTGRLDGIRADPDRLLRHGRWRPRLGRHPVYSSARRAAARVLDLWFVYSTVSVAQWWSAGLWLRRLGVRVPSLTPAGRS